MFKLFRPQPNLTYPLMRDPLRQPKCYEMTEDERILALKRSDELLKHRVAGQVPGYWGA